MTIENQDIDGEGTHGGDSAIVVDAGVERLWMRDCEITVGMDGIHFYGAVTGVKVVDNHIHGNGKRRSGVCRNTERVVDIYGNAFRANGGGGAAAS